MNSAKASFVVQATYAPDAAETRVPHRSEHLERLRKLHAEGALSLAGAFEDMSASLLMFEVASEEAVRAIIESDIYFKKKIWTDYMIKRLTLAALDG